jgi:hypothetical protein
MGRLRAHPLDGKPYQKLAHGGEADGATRSARRRGTATPWLRRPSGGVASLGPSAGVRSTLGFRPPKPAGRNTPRLDGRLPRVPELRTTRRRRPARRAFPRRGHGRGALGCGRPGHTRSTTIHKEKPRLDGRYSRAQGSARRHLAARRRVEGFPLGLGNWGAA